MDGVSSLLVSMRTAHNRVCSSSTLMIICNIILPLQVPIGISIATSIRVGNALGGGDPAAAKRTSFVAMGMACTYICEPFRQNLNDFTGCFDLQFQSASVVIPLVQRPGKITILS